MTTTPAQTAYASVNGLKMYYEIHGSGQPLILLHGGLGLTSMFGEVLPLLAKNRQVIAVDLQATAAPAISAALIRHLGLEKASLIGYSRERTDV